MSKVTSRLIYRHIEEPEVMDMFKLLEKDMEVQGLLRMANVMAVHRLGYNDHGPVHAQIASGSALEIFSILSKTLTPSGVKNGLTFEQSKNIVLCGSYLHDLGNAVHRVNHHLHGCYLANSILERVLGEVYPGDMDAIIKMKCEILHAIYAHDEKVDCLSFEAGVAKVADGTDMAHGRARMPYKTSSVSIHALSALAIKKVEIEEDHDSHVRILVYMDNPSGVFQIEEVMGEKIRTSGLSDWINVVGIHRGKEIKTF
ncbi:MAG: phosphohydrolase [Candidatus Ranarchaeia archaeon]